MHKEYRTIAVGIFLLLLSPVVLPITGLEAAPLVHVAAGIAGLLILSTSLVGILKA